MTGNPADKAVGQTVSTLNELMQTCRDGENCFRAAAESVEDSNLRHLFESYAQQRAEFAADLQLEVRRLVEDPLDTGHVERQFVEVKEAHDHIRSLERSHARTG